jgi:uncharacterized Zn-finger protein
MGAEHSQDVAAKCDKLMKAEPDNSVTVYEDHDAVVMYDPSEMFDAPRKKRKMWQELREFNNTCKKRLVRTTRGATLIQFEGKHDEPFVELPLEIYSDVKEVLSALCCKICSHVAANLSKLREHEITHCSEKSFKCDLCDYRCKTRGNLTQHVRRHSSDQSCKCDECDFMCTIPRDLMAHKQRKHAAEKKFKCEECDYVGLRNCDLIAHKRHHTLEKPCKCDMCPFTCSSRSGLIVHIRGHTGDKPYKCDKCDYACVSSGNLAVHRRKHSGEKPHTCDKCDYASTSRSHLQRHKRERHTGQKKYLCDSCDYMCNELHRLTQHTRKHTHEKPFKCDSCDYRCSTRSSLTMHTRRHLKLKPHKCDSCDYTGATRRRLVEHMWTHTLEKPFQCDLCDYACTSSGNLSRHKRKHAKPTYFPCPYQENSSELYTGQGLQCEPFFPSATSLGFHIKEHHDKAHVFKMPAELAVREALKQTFGEAMQHDWQNYMQLGSCESVGNSSYRFDFRTPAPEGFQMLVVTEVDEFQHRRYPCDLKRMLHAGQILMQEFPDTPIVFVRWNPDPRKIGAVNFNVPFKERVETLMRVLQNEAALENGKKMSDLVKQGLNVIYMYYDLEKHGGELDSRVCMLNGVTDENADNAATVRNCVISAL